MARRWPGWRADPRRRTPREPSTTRTPPAAWLPQACHGPRDVQNGPPDVPRTADGRPPLNPEHWGFWAGCDKHLWAWREVFRMAEVARIARDETVIHPRYDTTPLLRS